MRPVYTDITNEMLYISKQKLYQPLAQWVASRDPEFNISFNSGSGKSTYISWNASTKEIKYNYGAKCIEEHSDIGILGSWLSTIEVIERNYFGDMISYIDLLSHIMLHEHCHVVHIVKIKQHEEEGGHDENFYKLLDRIHQSDYRDIVNKDLKSFFSENRIPNKFKFGIETIPPEQMHLWRKLALDQGLQEEVTFKDGNSISLGKIISYDKGIASIMRADGKVKKIHKYQLFTLDFGAYLRQRSA